MKKSLFTGVCTALVTPFLNGSINFPLLERLLLRQRDAGIEAVVVGGTTGEAATLTDEEKRLACRLAAEAGADFVKTSTGFGSGGATAEDVALMKEAVQGKCLVKASTGINDRSICDAMLRAGAVRMGTSKGIRIVKGE